jgi:exopolysaccharide production protein ExoQ
VLILVLAAIVALSVATGSYRSDTGALTGYFASKNAMGAASALLAVAAAGQVGRPGRRGSYRAGGALALLLGAGGVVLSQSMGALVAMSIGLCTYPVLSVLRRLSLRLQVVVCIACVSLAGFVIVLLIANIDAVSAAILAATGKDITLTGRTDLWRVGLEQIAERPWLGQGYQAFWQPGNPEAEHLWRAFGIESRTGSISTISTSRTPSRSASPGPRCRRCSLSSSGSRRSASRWGRSTTAPPRLCWR